MLPSNGQSTTMADHEVEELPQAGPSRSWKREGKKEKKLEGQGERESYSLLCMTLCAM